MGRNTWYHDAHKFPHQERLCKAVEWTKYNIEGQKLKSSDCLSATYGNPLTIRLFALDKALELFDNVKTINKKLKKLEEKQLRENISSGMSGRWQGKSSSSDTKGAPIETIEFAGEVFDLRYNYIQLALYESFTNFGSILDRLAYEINRLYELAIPRHSLDWKKLTSEPELCKLSVKNQDLAELLSKYRNNFHTAIRYRNRLIHDGIIDFKVEQEHKCRYPEFRIKLRKTPDDDNSPFSVDAIEFCEDKREATLTLLNRSYELMLLYYEKCKKT